MILSDARALATPHSVIGMMFILVLSGETGRERDRRTSRNKRVRIIQ